MGLEETRLTSIKYQSLDDLVKFVCMTPQPFLNHIEREGKHLYFFLFAFLGGLVVYYFAGDRKIEGSYVSLNRRSGVISSLNKPTFDAQSIDLPILEVESTDLLNIMKS